MLFTHVPFTLKVQQRIKKTKTMFNEVYNNLIIKTTPSLYPCRSPVDIPPDPFSRLKVFLSHVCDLLDFFLVYNTLIIFLVLGTGVD